MTNLDRLILFMVKDLEDTRDIWHGYSYVRTMRNILIGDSDALIVPLFSKKPYYGIYSDLSLEETEAKMDKMVSDDLLEIIYTDHGKLYCTKPYFSELG